MDSTFFQQKLNTLRARITGIRKFQQQYEKELQLVTGSPTAQSKWKELIKGLKSQLEELSAEQELLVQQVANEPQESLRSEVIESLSRLRHDIKILQSEQAILLGAERASGLEGFANHHDLGESQPLDQNPPAPDQTFGTSLQATDVQLQVNAHRQQMPSSGPPGDAHSISTDSDRASSSAIEAPHPPIPPQERTLAPATQKTDHPDQLIEQVQKSTPATEPPRADNSGVARATRLWSLGVLLLIPIAAIAYALLPKSTVAPPAPMAKNPAADFNDSNLCTSTLTDREGQLNKLGERKERDKESFPQACQSKLDELFYVTGIEKAKGEGSAGSDFNEGVRRLCKISSSSADHLIVARSQLNAWYGNEQNPAFKKFISNYLNVLKTEGQTCPAAKDISP